MGIVGYISFQIYIKVDIRFFYPSGSKLVNRKDEGLCRKEEAKCLGAFSKAEYEEECGEFYADKAERGLAATLIGALLPRAAAKVKFDPAAVASPALTTVVDITGLFIFFTTAKLVLGI